MAITFVAATSGDNLAGATSTMIISVPAGVVNGDIMLVGMTIRDNNPTWAAQAGWTSLRIDNEGTQSAQAIYYRIASSEPASYTFNLPSSGKASGGIMAFRGVNTSSPIDVSGGQGNTGANVNCDAPSVSTTGANDMLVGFFGTTFEGATFTPPTGMTEAFDHPSGAGFNNSGCSTEGAYQLLSSSGATGTRTAVSDQSRPSIGQLVALLSGAGTGRLLASTGVGN